MRHQDNQLARGPSPRATRIGLLIIVPLALVVGVRTVSWAVPKVWSRGETLTADDLNRNFKSLDDAVAAANPWLECGTLESLRNGAAPCEVNDHPVDQYEYGFKYNGPEVHPAACLQWNVGIRIINREPYMVNSDDPSSGAMQLGGAMFYTNTNAADDDVPAPCAANTWRHRYWRVVGGSVVMDLGSNGCVNQPIYCRRR